MPALRWDECKKIADYQTITPPYTRDYILVLVALLAFPTGDDIAEYREMVGNAYLATGLIKSQELVDMWRSVLQVTPNWSFDDEIQAWVHPWGARQPANQQTRRIQEILSLLDV